MCADESEMQKKIVDPVTHPQDVRQSPGIENFSAPDRKWFFAGDDQHHRQESIYPRV
jgi:hypothetical protein